MSAAQSKSKVTRFKRVTDLFEEGREVVLDDNPDDPVLVWVNKINPFEMDEARKDGSVGKARAALRLDDPESAESVLFDQAIEGRDQENLAQALAYVKQNEDYVAALDDIRADEEWKPKVELLERGDAQMADAGIPMDDDEQKRLADLNQAYMKHLAELVDKRQAKRVAELQTLSVDDLQEDYRKSYRDQAGSNGFLSEYRTTELYYALRDCVATPNENLGWDHAKCSHRERLCGSRAEVRELPGGLIEKVREAITLLNMSPRDAGNSDAPASSSASSERASAVVASTPSTPDATSAGQGGTSSQQ